MQIKRFLSPDDVIVGLNAPDKNGAIKELSRRAAAALKMSSEQISAALLKREHLGSTGMGDGIAIPHARIDGLTSPYGVLARLSKPIDFMSVDGLPVDLVFLLLLPATSSGEQLNVLACVARKLRDPLVLHELRLASDSATIYRRITAEDKKG